MEIGSNVVSLRQYLPRHYYRGDRRISNRVGVAEIRGECDRVGTNRFYDKIFLSRTLRVDFDLLSN